ncbi:hypothetical protein KKA15_05925 [Patescibacteria group bacterium]|nr:hypothetical protein [Patescibacteria group bacterium]
MTSETILDCGHGTPQMCPALVVLSNGGKCNPPQAEMVSSHTATTIPSTCPNNLDEKKLQ